MKEISNRRFGYVSLINYIEKKIYEHNKASKNRSENIILKIRKESENQTLGID